ncbi:MAG: class I SAM-dependent methyltransferase [Candidatus Kapabacteria bacterium]|nr:class I SAM-dependent methyltransferase [Candidatus Kapabacteria bacterium]
MSYYDIIQEAGNIPDNDKYYWGYQYNLATSYIIPFLEGNGTFKPGMSVCEVGCAEGGVLTAFIEHGATDALGTDISHARLASGNRINAELGIQVKLLRHDILGDLVPNNLIGKFDLILLRDVIEHLPTPYSVLKTIYNMLKPGGRLYVTFPPYYSPYGGHQHTLDTTVGKIPFLHYLPKPILQKVISHGRPADIEEVLRLKGLHLTSHNFLLSVKTSNFKIVKEKYYFIRPVFKMKFGMPPISSTALRHLPFVKEVFSMEAGYILEK